MSCMYTDWLKICSLHRTTVSRLVSRSVIIGLSTSLLFLYVQIFNTSVSCRKRSTIQIPPIEHLALEYAIFLLGMRRIRNVDASKIQLLPTKNVSTCTSLIQWSQYTKYWEKKFACEQKSYCFAISYEYSVCVHAFVIGDEACVCPFIQLNLISMHSGHTHTHRA